MANKLIGSAWVHGIRKPFVDPREIMRGRNKGKFEIRLTRGRHPNGRIRLGKLVIVPAADIKIWPCKGGF